jgi:putative transcriptional regulator
MATITTSIPRRSPGLPRRARLGHPKPLYGGGYGRGLAGRIEQDGGRPPPDANVTSLRGQLLVAGGGLFDPNFRHTVVLLAEHSEEGAMGIVLNRPSSVAVADATPALGSLLAPEEHLYLGGPVQTQVAIVVAEFEHPDLASRLILGSIGFPGEVEEERLRGVRRARVFAGFAGWGPGQLERELEQLSWIVEPARPSDVFTDDPTTLWATVLRRKGGRYAMLALMPFDPSTN